MARRWSLSAVARRRPVVRNAATLALAASAARVFDAGYRVVVARLIGPETVGLLQMAGSVYAFALGLATLGLSPALARLIAAQRAKGADRRRTGQPETAERQAVATAFALAGPAGVTAALALLAAAPWLAGRVLSDPRVAAPLRILALGLVPAAFCGVLRGRLQGAQRMVPLAAAQFLEPVIRLSVALFALLGVPALWAVPVPFAPAVLLAGFAVLGETVECLFLAGWQSAGSLWARLRATGARRAPDPAPRAGFSPPVAAQLLRSSLPLMLSQFFFASVALLDAGLLPRLLAASGLTAAQATREYGLLHGMVVPFLFFPMTLVFPVGAVLMPAVAEAKAAGDRRLLNRRISLAVRAALCVEALAALLYLAVPRQLAALVNGGDEAALLIRGLVIWLPFAYVDHIGNSALVGLGATRAALADGMLNAAVRLAVYCLCVPHPELRLKGALLGFAAGDAAGTAAHFLRLAWLTSSVGPNGGTPGRAKPGRRQSGEGQSGGDQSSVKNRRKAL